MDLGKLVATTTAIVIAASTISTVNVQAAEKYEVKKSKLVHVKTGNVVKGYVVYKGKLYKGGNLNKGYAVVGKGSTLKLYYNATLKKGYQTTANHKYYFKDGSLVKGLKKVGTLFYNNGTLASGVISGVTYEKGKIITKAASLAKKKKQLAGVLATIKINKSAKVIKVGDKITINKKNYTVSVNPTEEKGKAFYITLTNAKSLTNDFNTIKKQSENKKLTLGAAEKLLKNLNNKIAYFEYNATNAENEDLRSKAISVTNMYFSEETKQAKLVADIQKQMNSAVAKGYKVTVKKIQPIVSEYTNTIVSFEVKKVSTGAVYTANYGVYIFSKKTAIAYMEAKKATYAKSVKINKKWSKVSSGDTIVVDGKTYYVTTYPDTKLSGTKKYISVWYAQLIEEHLAFVKNYSTKNIKATVKKEIDSYTIRGISANWSNENFAALKEVDHNLLNHAVVLSDKSTDTVEKQITKKIQVSVPKGYKITVKKVEKSGNNSYNVSYSLSNTSKKVTADFSRNLKVKTTAEVAAEIKKEKDKLTKTVKRLVLPATEKEVKEGMKITIDGTKYGVSEYADEKTDALLYLMRSEVSDLYEDLKPAEKALKANNLSAAELENINQNLVSEIKSTVSRATNLSKSTFKRALNKKIEEFSNQPVFVNGKETNKQAVTTALKKILATDEKIQSIEVDKSSSSSTLAEEAYVSVKVKKGSNTIENFTRITIFKNTTQAALKNKLKKELVQLMNSVEIPKRDSNGNITSGTIKVDGIAYKIASNQQSLSDSEKYVENYYAENLAYTIESVTDILASSTDKYSVLSLYSAYTNFKDNKDNLEHYLVNKTTMKLGEYTAYLDDIELVGNPASVTNKQFREAWLKSAQNIVGKDIIIDMDRLNQGSEYWSLFYTIIKNGESNSSYSSGKFITSKVNK